MAHREDNNRRTARPTSKINSVNSSKDIESVRTPSCDTISKRSHTTSACQACKKRKRKCSGEPPPCNACIVAQTECLFNNELDQRRKIAIKRKSEEIEFHKQFLNRLLESLRTSEEEEAQSLLRLIRSGASMTEIVEVIDSSIAMLKESPGSPENGIVLDDLLQFRSGVTNLQDQSGDKRTRRKALSIEEINDTPLVNVPAKPWTTVTDDDDLVSHLISLYLTWGRTYWHPVVEDIFVEAMLTADIASPLCSPFLVNAILGIASHLSMAPDAFYRPGDLLGRGEQFFNEARRLWDVGDNSASLTNLQGFYIIFLDSNLRGKDKAGWLLMGQVIQMFNDLELSDKIKIPKTCPEALQAKMEQSFSKCAWTLASGFTIFALALLRRPPLAPPRIHRPSFAADTSLAVSWGPYPQQGRNEMIYYDAIFDAYCDLSEIIFEVGSSATFRTGDGLASEMIAFTNRVQSWHKNLPESVKLYPTAPGPLMELHLIYYWILIVLSEFSHRSSESSSNGTHAEDINSTVRSQTTALIHQAMPIFWNYRHTYGIARVGATSSHVASAMCYILLKSAEDPDNEQPLIDLCIWLIVGARCWMVYAGVVRSFRPTAQQLHVRLPPKVDQTLQDFEKNLRDLMKDKRLSSVMPNLSLVTHPADAEDFALGDLLAKWEIMELGT